MHKFLLGLSVLALLALPACGDDGGDGGMDMPDAGDDNPDASTIDSAVEQECLPEQISSQQTVTLSSPLPLMGTAPNRESGGVVLTLSMEDPVDGVGIQFTEGAGVFSEGFGTVTDGQIATDPQNCGACMLGFVNAPSTSQGIDVSMAELVYGVESGTIQVTNYEDPTEENTGNIAGSIENLVLSPEEGDCANSTVNFDFDFDLSVASSAREVEVRRLTLNAAEVAPR